MLIYLIAVSMGLFVFLLIVLGFSEYGKKKDQIRKRIHSVGTVQKKFSIDEELSKPIGERFFKPIWNALVQGARKYLPKENVINSDQNIKVNKMKKTLRQAGVKMSVSEYNLVRLIVMAGLGFLFSMIAFLLDAQLPWALATFVIGLYFSYVILRFQLARRVSLRQSEMQKLLPEVLDMLSISVEAGLGLEQAMIKVVEHFDGPLIDEIAVTNREMTMGRNRKEALILLGDRCEIEEMKTFVRALVQAMQLGISMKNVLRSQSVYMRQTRKNKIEEKAMKVSVKILIPMAFFIFPVMFIILLGPAAYNIMTQFM